MGEGVAGFTPGASVTISLAPFDADAAQASVLDALRANAEFERWHRWWSSQPWRAPLYHQIPRWDGPCHPSLEERYGTSTTVMRLSAAPIASVVGYLHGYGDRQPPPSRHTLSPRPEDVDACSRGGACDGSCVRWQTRAPRSLSHESWERRYDIEREVAAILRERAGGCGITAAELRAQRKAGGW